MKAASMILLGVKNKVTAISIDSGMEIWSTKLPGSGMGADFVTLLSTETHIFAHSKGQLTALDAKTGDVLWTNNLPGLGYGLASLAIPGGPSSPDVQAISHIHSQQQSAGTVGAAGAGGGG